MSKANNNATYEIGIMFRLFSILHLENHRPLRGNNRALHPFVYAYTVARTLVKSTASMIKRIGVMSTKLSHVIVILSPYFYWSMKIPHRILLLESIQSVKSKMCAEMWTLESSWNACRDNGTVSGVMAGIVQIKPTEWFNDFKKYFSKAGM